MSFNHTLLLLSIAVLLLLIIMCIFFYIAIKTIFPDARLTAPDGKVYLNDHFIGTTPMVVKIPDDSANQSNQIKICYKGYKSLCVKAEPFTKEAAILLEASNNEIWAVINLLSEKAVKSKLRPFKYKLERKKGFVMVAAGLFGSCLYF